MANQNCICVGGIQRAIGFINHIKVFQGIAAFELNAFVKVQRLWRNNTYRTIYRPTYRVFSFSAQDGNLHVLPGEGIQGCNGKHLCEVKKNEYQNRRQIYAPKIRDNLASLRHHWL